jgi:energy-coupling factor transporter ATP-binding protein EcfA2
MKLERADIARLRGIPGDWPALVIGDKGLIVYGPNGVGKSSIIDALEATIRGRSSLFKENRADGVNWDDASPHVTGGPPSCTVYGKFKGKDLSLSMGADPVADLTDWVNAARAASFVLRRYMLLQFIDGQPVYRYGQIEPFLNLSSFNQLELGLKALADDFETKFVEARTKATEKVQIVRQTFGLAKEATLSRAELTQLLKEKLVKAKIGDADLNDLATLNQAIAAELGGQAAGQKFALLGGIKAQAQQLTSVSVVKPIYEEALAAAETLANEIKSVEQTVSLELLVLAKDHVAATSPKTCPVCEKIVDPAKLLIRLNERIKENEAVQQAAHTLDLRLKSLVKAAAKAREAYGSFRPAWTSTGLGPLPPCYENAEALFGSLEGLTTANVANGQELVKTAFVDAECDPSLEIAKIDGEIAAIGGTELRSALSDAAACVTALLGGGDVAILEKSEKEAARASKQKTQLSKLYAHAQAARKEAVQKIADKIADVANAFYDQVHPGEEIATAKLTVRPNVANSLNLNSTFFGSEAPPLKYYSESHLDTLGLCFFLAIRKLEIEGTPLFKLLLIDDVLHSVDAEHRTRLAQLLKSHFADHQIVLVTHDKNFYERLKATLGGGYKYLAISSWDIDTGPHLSDPSTDLDRVINPATWEGKSHEELAAAGGRFFEWLLKELTEKLQVPIVARFTHGHDIGSMWPPLAAKLDKNKGFSAAHTGLVKKINDNGWVRNKIGAHHNEQESSETPKEVTEFIDALAELYKATTCAEEKCGTAIEASKANKDIWRCGCSKLQYDAK